jgi:hypothetical protein
MLPEDAILARELGRLGGIGAKFVARFLATNVGEREMTVLASSAEVRAAVRAAFGSYLEDEPPDGTLRVRVGAGKMNLNPALVTFALASASQDRTAVRIRGAAKEGWVKQLAGEQAADRAAEWLKATFGTAAPPPGGRA